jgi:hypothetical protein
MHVVKRIHVGIVRINVAIYSNAVGMPRPHKGGIWPLSGLGSWVSRRGKIAVARWGCRCVAIRMCSRRSGLWKSPLDGTIELVEIKIRQPVISKAPDPGLWCACAPWKTKTGGSVVPTAITRTEGIGSRLWTQALGRGTKVDIGEITVVVDGEVTRMLAGLCVDIIDLREKKFRGGESG